MTPKSRATLAPRILVLIGMAIIVLSVMNVLSPTLTAAAQMAGGLVALGGLIWFLMASRAAR